MQLENLTFIRNTIDIEENYQNSYQLFDEYQIFNESEELREISLIIASIANKYHRSEKFYIFIFYTNISISLFKNLKNDHF